MNPTVIVKQHFQHSQWDELAQAWTKKIQFIYSEQGTLLYKNTQVLLRCFENDCSSWTAEKMSDRRHRAQTFYQEKEQIQQATSSAIVKNLWTKILQSSKIDWFILIDTRMLNMWCYWNAGLNMSPAAFFGLLGFWRSCFSGFICLFLFLLHYLSIPLGERKKSKPFILFLGSQQMCHCVTIGF